jgi:hypothetical protein
VLTMVCGYSRFASAVVVQLRLPHWPTASDGDAITCAEVKTKDEPVDHAVQSRRRPGGQPSRSIEAGATGRKSMAWKRSGVRAP